MCKRLLAGVLAFSWGLAPLTFGQVRGYLTLRVVEGDGAFNDIRRGFASRPVVEVRDEANNTVSGASVSFTLPSIGAGGTFSDGKNTSTVTTDAQGLARAGEFKPNLTEGRFNIRVTATYQGKQGNVVLAQTNTLAGGGAAKSGGHAKYWILAVVAVGAGVGAALALGHGKSSPAPIPPTVLSSGGITVGGPQ